MARREVWQRCRGKDRRIFSGVGFFPFEAAFKFPVVLFGLVPPVPLIEDGRKTHDQQEGDQKDQRIEISAMGFHVGPLVPSGREIDEDGYNEQQSNGNSDEELAEDLLAAQAVGFPVADEILFLRGEHGSMLRKVRYL